LGAKAGKKKTVADLSSTVVEGCWGCYCKSHETHVLTAAIELVICSSEPGFTFSGSEHLVWRSKNASCWYSFCISHQWWMCNPDIIFIHILYHKLRGFSLEKHRSLMGPNVCCRSHIVREASPGPPAAAHLGRVGC
jgi:hypothetical protein